METFIDRPLFLTDDTARAAGVPVETLKNWIKRGQIDLINPEEPNREVDVLQVGTGRVRRFTFRRVVQIALTAELSRRGIQVEDASGAALHFTDLGKAEGGFGPTTLIRAPGELFRGDLTILRVLFSEDGKIEETDVVKLKQLGVIFGRVSSKLSASVVLVNVNEIVDRVKRGLGIEGVPQ